MTPPQRPPPSAREPVAPQAEGPRRPTLWYNDGTLSIVRRDQRFAVIHNPNVRWFTTDQSGAELSRRLAEALQQGEEQLPCHRSEQQFLERVFATAFLTAAQDLPVATPTVLSLSITDRCNLQCDYCFYAATPQGRRPPAPPLANQSSVLRTLLGQLKALNGGLRVYLTGGEPFINREIGAYVQLIKAAGLYAGVVTNGTLLNAARLAAVERQGLDEIRISLDGASQATHEATRPRTFRKVMEALRRLEGGTLQVVLSMTVTRHNQHEVPALAHFARARGFAINYSPMLPSGRGAEHPELLPDYGRLVLDLREIERDEGFSLLDREGTQGWRRHTCGLAGQSLYADLQGHLFPCNLLSDTDAPLGNGFSSPVASLLASSDAVALRAGVDTLPHCRACHVRYLCGGPCRAAAHFGSATDPQPAADCPFRYAEIIEALLAHGRFIPGPPRQQNGTHTDPSPP